MGMIYLTLMFTLALVNFFLLFFFFRKQKNNYIFFVFIAIVIACFGHALLGFSTNLESAIIANKVNYIGASFIQLFMFFALLQVCRIKIHMVVRLLMIGLCLFVLGLSLTVGFSPVYYKTVEFVIQNGVGNYIPTYGWGHNVFNFMMVFFTVLDLIVVFYVSFKQKMVSLKNIVAIFLTVFISIFSFFLSRYMENDMLIMPTIYLLDQIALLYICMNIKWYDVTSCVMESLDEDNTSAFISFSAKGVYLGSNRIAKKFFPDLLKCRIDSKMSSEFKIGEILNPFVSILCENNKLDTFDFSYGEKYYKSTVHCFRLWYFKDIYVFKVEDNTNVQLHIEFLGKNHSKLKQLVTKNAYALQLVQEQMIVGMANMVENRDGNTGGHIKRTSQVIKILVSEMRKDKSLKMSSNFYDALISAAPMHDLGKIAIDDQILRKPGRFTDEEFTVMKSHAEKGAVIVENLLTEIEEPFFVTISKNVAYYHHEWWNGKGYPKGLKGEEIPIEARIMAIADVYDALVSSRCYKKPMSFGQAYDLILSSMGSQFDPSLEKYFIACNNSLKDYYMSVNH